MELKVNEVRSHLLEVTRKDLVTKSRVQSKTRYKKRLNYQVSNFRGVDLKQLFENDYFVFKTPISNYVCIVAFPGVFTQLRKVVKQTHGDVNRINLQMVIKALSRAFDATDDVKVDCTCADWKYRYAYWASQNGYKYGPAEDRPSDKTNPDDTLGATCKHLNLLLSNKRWLTKAASVVNAFIKAYPDKAAKYLYDEDEIKKPDEEEEPDGTSGEVPSESNDDKVVDQSGKSDRENSKEETGESKESSEEVTDSLHLSEDLVTSDDDFLDMSDSGRDWIPEQRTKIYEITKRFFKYFSRLDLSDHLKFLGYRKFSRKENYATFTAVDMRGKEFNFWITFSGGQYRLISTSGMVKKVNQDPQKIVKYVVDNLIY